MLKMTDGMITKCKIGLVGNLGGTHFAARSDLARAAEAQPVHKTRDRRVYSRCGGVPDD